MPEIKDTVGEKGKNLVHDVALGQVMLVLAKNAKGERYLKEYDSAYGKHTPDAISAFQRDQLFPHVPAYKGSPSEQVKELAHQDWRDMGTAVKPAAPDITADLIKPKDATFQKLVSLLPDTHKEIRIIENTRT